MDFIRMLVKKIGDGLVWSFRESKPCFTTFGVAVFFGIIGFYFLNSGMNAEDVYENIALRCIGAVLVIPIIFNKFWPKKWDKLFIWYWYLVLTYTLPFFFSFMILMNPYSTIWQVNGMVCLILLVLVADLSSFLILLILGVSAGICFYLIKSPTASIFIPDELKQVLYCYIGPIIYIILFSRKKEKIQEHKIESMKMVAEFIAHELRTPLSAMTIGSQNLGTLMPVYYEAYQQAKQAKLPTRKLSDHQEKNLRDLPGLLENVSRNANTMISMLLTNLIGDLNGKKLDVCSMAQCVREALNTYPFSCGERELVHWQDPTTNPGNENKDFNFNGNIELTKHIIFNLLKNSLHSIACAGKGEIFITLECSEKKLNSLVFRDTALGVAPDKLDHVFDRFYTTKAFGAGIGLAFCRTTVAQFGGDITCKSKLGEYACFTMSFPIVANTDGLFERT